VLNISLTGPGHSEMLLVLNISLTGPGHSEMLLVLNILLTGPRHSEMLLVLNILLTGPGHSEMLLVLNILHLSEKPLFLFSVQFNFKQVAWFNVFRYGGCALQCGTD
jgi:hypothetical protein